MKLVLYTPPSVEPVTLTEVKMNMRLVASESDATSYTTEDNLLTRLIAGAREYVEHYLRQSLITQTWDLYLDEWPIANFINLPMSPVQSVTSLTYTDYEGTETSFTDFAVDTVSDPGRAVLTYNSSWPDVELTTLNPIKVRYVAGYGATSASVPTAVKTAIHLLITHLYENREAAVVRSSVLGIEKLPFGVEAHLDQIRSARL